MKKVDTMLKKYVEKLSFDNLKYLSARLDNRLGDDMPEALDAVATVPDINQWLMTAKSCDKFYDMVDLIQEYVDREIGKRVPEMATS